MSRNYADMEHEFLGNLKADTGRDLAEWMATIDAQAFAHRNDAIDWLRQQGFLFAWASWLERIHNNGGEPIYCRLDSGDVSAKQKGTSRQAPAAPAPEPVTSAPQPQVSPAIVDKRPPPPVVPSKPSLRLVHSSDAVREPAGQPQQGATMEAAPDTAVVNAPAEPTKPTIAPPPVMTSVPAAASPARKVSATSPDLAAIIASAKAYAPLAGFIVRRIQETVPDSEIKASGKQIAFHAGALPFALLVVGSKDLRLAFAGPEGDWTAPVEQLRLPKNSGSAAPSLTHMLVLTDARQIDAAFENLVAEARKRTPSQERR